MKKTIALTSPLVLLIFVVLTLAVLERRRGPDWQRELHEYIARSSSPSETITVQSVVEAREPWNFREAMGEAVRDDWRWTVTELPFPPLGVQCVLLERARGATTGAQEHRLRQVVFVGYHTDGLYRVGWVVHKGPQEPFARELHADLAMIGCELGLGREGHQEDPDA